MTATVPPRDVIVPTVCEAVDCYARTHHGDIIDAGNTFFATIGPLIEGYGTAGRFAVLWVVAARAVQRAIAPYGLSLLDVINNREGLVIGSIALRDGEERSVEVLCEVCKLSGRFASAVGNGEYSFAFELFKPMDDYAWSRVLANLLWQAVGHPLRCTAGHLEELAADI